MRTACTILILTLISFGRAGLADSGCSVKGRVLDATSREPISQAVVGLAGTSRFTATDAAGFFSLDQVAPGLQTLEVSRVGYLKQTREVSLAAGGGVSVTLLLQPAVISMDGITVTASRFAESEFSAPQSVSITPRRRFVERNFSTTAEVLREEPGILVQKTTYGHGAPVLRGLIGKHVLLLYDGIRLNKPTFRFGANQYLNTIDLESVDLVEVVRGPSSVMYGSDAIGGAVNLIPSSVPDGDGRLLLSPRMATRFSSADAGRSFHLELLGRYEQIATSIGGTYKKIGDLRAGGDIGKQTPTGWEELDFNARVYATLNECSRLRLDYLAVRQDGVPRYDKYASGDFQRYIYDPQDRDLAALTFDADLRCSFPHLLKAGLSYQRESEGTAEQRSGAEKITVSEDEIDTWGGYLQLSGLIDRRHLLSLGWEYYYDHVASQRVESLGDDQTPVRPAFPDGSRYHSAGLFLQDDYTLQENLSLTLGARYSYFLMKSPLAEPFGEFNESYDDLTGSLSLGYKVTPAVNLICGWSRGFRAPGLNDAVVLKYSSSGVDAPSNGLQPEYSNNFEIGAKLRAERLAGSLFAYYNQLDDLIDRVPGTYEGKSFFDENGNGVKDEGEFDIYQRRNVARSRIYGFECDGRVRFSPRWELRANAFWTRGENQTDHEPLSRIPPLMGMLALRYHAGDNLWIEAFSRMAGAQRRLSARDIDDSRIDEGGTDSWVTFNLRSRVNFRGLTLNVTLENLLDESYKEHGSGIYSPGRNLLVGLSYGDG